MIYLKKRANRLCRGQKSLGHQWSKYDNHSGFDEKPWMNYVCSMWILHCVCTRIILGFAEVKGHLRSLWATLQNFSDFCNFQRQSLDKGNTWCVDPPYWVTRTSGFFIACGQRSSDDSRGQSLKTL